MDEDDDVKVILKLGYYTKLCIRSKAALKIMRILSKEAILKQEDRYKDGKGWKLLRPYGTEDITIELISPADFLLQCAAGEEKEV